MTTNQQLNLNEIFPSLITMMIVVMMMKMMSTAIKGIAEPVKPKAKPLYPGGAPYGEFLKAPEEREITAAIEKETITRVYEEAKAEGQRIAEELGVEYVEPWMAFGTCAGHWYQKAGEKFVARDIKEARYKLERIRQRGE